MSLIQNLGGDKTVAKSKTPSFVTTISLVVDSKQESELLARFQASRQLYNACLNEAVTRMELVKNSDIYQAARKLPREQKKQRSNMFSEARKLYRYSDYELQAYATLVSNKSKWIADKIDSNTQQTIATRAFRASEKVLFGLAKKVRFKTSNRFRSVEGKTNKQGLRWKDNQVVWGKLRLNSIIDKFNPVIQHGLNSPVKYIRLLWKEINGKRRWFIQIINEGIPHQKPQNYVLEGTIGLDLNISNIAFVSDNQAGLLPFADKVPNFQKEITRLQQKMQRSQRANNPDNYEPDFLAKKGRKIVTKKGKVKKGNRRWNKSKSYKKVAQKKRELERRKTSYAKSQNRKVVNEVLRHGSIIKTEKVSVKGWQKRYGKAISAKSPGFVQSELKRKAESAGGQFITFSTQKTALSQTHLDGSRIKKSLSQRVHRDVTGVVMHRDIFSAFLSRYVNEDQLSLQDAQYEYPRLESILKSAWQQYRINCEQVSASESRLSHLPSEQFDLQGKSDNQIAVKREKLS
ncbi:transposase, IS608 family protein [Nostoc commune NIES-4072]|uniref:Transposase, IS608 family protein n=1 Tax=Nostoc commune NIES-4072 TaxID=2005467 RepID=A0A2R5FGG8_NOSCO|nr:transposase [Nostoc commune]BBD64983.1 transposase, IS608 family protein [Nostoc commune HK-02]GBG17692.1 transposase, IS608 family protein [Nostoc commune NIES-4072]